MIGDTAVPKNATHVVKEVLNTPKAACEDGRSVCAWTVIARSNVFYSPLKQSGKGRVSELL